MLHKGPCLLVCFITLFISPWLVCPSLGSIQEPDPPDVLSSPNSLLQFQSSEGHILGFSSDRFYLVGMGYGLIETFVGTNDTLPVAKQHASNSSNQTAPAFEQVTYVNLWDGINLQYNSSNSGLAESLYTLSPHADPDEIRLSYSIPFQIAEDGSLRFKHPTKRGWFSQTAPVAWQIIDGRKVMLEVAFHDWGDNTLGFRLGSYDPEHPVIIDPTYQWHTFYGAAGHDYGRAIAVDGSGNVYVVGHSIVSWLGDGDTAPLHAHSGSDDITVLKLTSSGVYQWHTFYGSTSKDEGHDIAVDGAGTNVYITGISDGNWLGDSSTDPIHAFSNYDEIMVLKLNSSGAYQWHTFYGSSSGADYGYGIAVDSNNDILVAGRTGDSWQGDGNTSPIHASSMFDIAVLKLDSDGAYQWHTFYGGSSVDFGFAIGVDTSRNVYVAGSSNASWQGDSSTDPFHSHSGDSDITVLKLDPSGSYQWHTFYGGSGTDVGNGIAVSGSDIYIAGQSSSTWQGDGNTDPLHGFSGTNDITLLKLNTSGTYQWHTFYGGGSTDNARDITVDGNGDVYVAAESYTSWQGDDNSDPLHAHSSNFDITALKLDPYGSYRWHTFYGSSNEDYGHGITVDGNGNVLLVGYGYSWLGDGSTEPIHAHNQDMDITVLKLSGQSLLTVIGDGTGSGTVTSSPAGIDCGSDCSESYTDDTEVTLSASAQTGSSFNGWSGGGCSGTTPCVITVSRPETVTATFSINTYTVTANGAGTGSGTVASDVGGINYTYPGTSTETTSALNHGTEVMLTATAGTGSTASWNDCQAAGGTASGNGTAVATCTFASLSENETVTATFTPVAYTLTVTPAGTGTGTVTSTPAGIDCGADCSEDYDYNTGVSLSADAAADSTFTGWSGDSADCDDGQLTITEDINCTATFDLNSYTVSTSAPAEEGYFTPTSRTVVHGNSTTLNVYAQTGYSIATVNGCGGTWTGSNPYTTGPITADCTVSATFTRNSYTVSTSAPAGEGYFTPTSRTVLYGDVATFEVYAETGFAVDNVSGCNGSWTGSNPYTTGAITGNCTVSATFQPYTFRWLLFHHLFNDRNRP